MVFTQLIKTRTMKTEFTHEELRTARHSLPKLSNLLNALEDLDGTVIKEDKAQAAITVFEEGVRRACRHYEGIVAEGNALYSNRDKKLINEAATRLMAIPNDIVLLEAAFKGRVKASEHKARVLREQGLSQSEIDLVNKPVTEADHQELAEKIETLRHEEASIKAFLADTPIYDTELLKNTSVYPQSTGVSQ